MKLNSHTVLLGNKVALVPYKKHHVEKYNSWMRQNELQELTASEPLTLEQEYEMQESWSRDELKLTFIILDLTNWRKKLQEYISNEPNKTDCHDASFYIEKLANLHIDDITKIEECSMVGDVNLFCTENSWSENVEISLMVAEPVYRRKGLGTEAAKIMMQYAAKELCIKSFIAKISLHNVPSIKLFENVLHFKKIGESEIFQEITMKYCAESDKHNVPSMLYSVMKYDVIL